MQITEKNQERSTIIIIIITLFVIGVSLLFSTWQTLKNQEESGDQHFYITARSVYQAIEIAIRFNAQTRFEQLNPDQEKFLNDIEQNGDLLFVGLIDSSGGRILTKQSPEGNLKISKQERLLMSEQGEWHGRSFLDNLPIYVYSKRIFPVFEANKKDTPSLQIQPPKDRSKDVFLVVGVDISKHLALYKGFRHNAFFQGLYVMVAAILTFALAMNFIARRELVGRAVNLEKFQTNLLRNLPDGLLTINNFGVIQSANPAAISILHSAFPLFFENMHVLLGSSVQTLPKELVKCLAPEEYDSNGIKHSTWRQCNFEGAALEIFSLVIDFDNDESRNQYGEQLVIIRDRTTLKSLEKSLAEAEKLAAVGTLAASVAHEIRNPLSALRGFAQLFAKKMLGKEPEYSYAETMVREADRLNRVVTDLLFLAKPSQLSPKNLDLNAIVRDLETLVRLELSKNNINFKAYLNAELVFADQDSLRQVLLNLVLNSVDAMSQASSKANLEPGNIKSSFVVCLESDQDIYGGKKGVWVRVKDNGAGVAPETLEHVFKPFFSTKDKNKGTGLGLTLVDRFMREHGGAALIDSELNKGTTVALFFPEQEL